MKYFKYIIPVLVTVIVTASCKKSFLDVTDNSKLNSQSYVKDLNSMEEFVNGIYVLLSTKYAFYENAAYPELIADDLKVSNPAGSMALHSNWSQVADATGAGNSISMNGMWREYYLIIRSCNFVVESIDKYADENPDKAKNLMGQAYAIRAMVHHQLANVFAQGYAFTANASHPGIPYITTSDITKPYSRQTVAEVYTNLIADLQTAISLMPAATTDCRFMNRAAAKALLSRIYLFKEDYTNAKNLSDELIKQFPLMSVGAGYPIDLFKNKQQSQTEILFQLTPVFKDGLVSDFIGICLELMDFYRATADIATILKENPNDIRNTWVTNTGSYWQVTKFPPGVAGGLGYYPAVDYYIPIFRTSEMLLTAAEAAAKTNDEENARLYLNSIRKRADPTIADITATGKALLDSIYKERRKEFCFEGLRMWDLQRWKLGVRRKDVLPGYQTTLTYPNDKAIAPIPGQDVSLMRLRQNDGY